jgi:hypothetical protein
MDKSYKTMGQSICGKRYTNNKYEYLNQVVIRNLSDFKKLSEVIKLHYNEYRPHQSFDNKTPVEVRIEQPNIKQKYLHPKKMENWNAFYWSIPGRTNTAK